MHIIYKQDFQELEIITLGENEGSELSWSIWRPWKVLSTFKEQTPSIKGDSKQLEERKKLSFFSDKE